MEFPKLTASFRALTGKGPVRRIRVKGELPAVLYGRELSSVPLTISPAALTQALTGPLRRNTIIELKIDGAKKGQPKKCNAIVRDYQFDPVSRELLHIDFLTVDVTRTISIEIPLRLVGRSIGEQAGGILSVARRTIPVQCLPANIPAEIEADISDLDIDSRLFVSDLEIPAEAEIGLPPTMTLATVQLPKKEEEKEEAAEITEETEEGAEEGAPAAGEKPAEEKKEGE